MIPCSARKDQIFFVVDKNERNDFVAILAITAILAILAISILV
jgi:hypothetical protein